MYTYLNITQTRHHWHCDNVACGPRHKMRSQRSPLHPSLASFPIPLEGGTRCNQGMMWLAISAAASKITIIRPVCRKPRMSGEVITEKSFIGTFVNYQCFSVLNYYNLLYLGNLICFGSDWVLNNIKQVFYAIGSFIRFF